MAPTPHHPLPPLAPQRYKQLLHFASRLDPLPAEFHTPEHKVEGCVSQVWVAAQLDRAANTLSWRADSDSQLTKVGPACWGRG